MPYLIGAGYGLQLGDPDADHAEECRGVGELHCEGVHVPGGDGYDGWCPSCADQRFADEHDNVDDQPGDEAGAHSSSPATRARVGAR